MEDTGPTPAPTPVLRTYPDDPIMEQTWAEVNYNLTNAPTSMPATGLKVSEAAAENTTRPYRSLCCLLMCACVAVCAWYQYVKCRDHYKAFGGAWLAARSLVDKTSFPPHRVSQPSQLLPIKSYVHRRALDLPALWLCCLFTGPRMVDALHVRRAPAPRPKEPQDARLPPLLRRALHGARAPQ